MAAYRQSIIERVLDLEIVAGTKKEKDRAQESLRMMDARVYPLEALDEMRKFMVAVLSQRNHPPEETRSQEQPQRDYIQ